MQTHWILDALADLTRYAEDHDMEELVRHLEEARDSVANAAPETNEDRFSKLNRQMGMPRRLH